MMKTFRQHLTEAVHTVYHGTDKTFKNFGLKYTTQGIIWFTSNKAKIVAGNVGAQGRGRIITAHVTLNKPAGWKEYNNLLLVQLKSQGYDGAILPDGDGSYDCFVFSPNQIKIVSVE